MMRQRDFAMQLRRMAVEIGRGRVACLRRSGDRGFEGNSSSEAETAFDSM